MFLRVKLKVVQLNSPGLENGHQFELFFLGFILLWLISFMCTSRVHGVHTQMFGCLVFVKLLQSSDSGVLVDPPCLNGCLPLRSSSSKLYLEPVWIPQIKV